jgi:hypothetical protein
MTRGAGVALMAYGTLSPHAHPEAIMTGALLAGLDQVTAYRPQNDRSPKAGSDRTRGF